MDFDGVGVRHPASAMMVTLAATPRMGLWIRAHGVSLLPHEEADPGRGRLSAIVRVAHRIPRLKPYGAALRRPGDTRRLGDTRRPGDTRHPGATWDNAPGHDCDP